MPYNKPKSDAYLARKEMLAARRARQLARPSAYDADRTEKFAAHWKAVRKRNGVGRPTLEKRATRKPRNVIHVSV